jgi:hypothetical protein
MGAYEEGRYTVELLREDNDQVEYEFAREGRSEVARMLYALMQARFSGRLVVLRVGEVVLDRGDRVVHPRHGWKPDGS